MVHIIVIICYCSPLSLSSVFVPGTQNYPYNYLLSSPHYHYFLSSLHCHYQYLHLAGCKLVDLPLWHSSAKVHQRNYNKSNCPTIFSPAYLKHAFMSDFVSSKYICPTFFSRYIQRVGIIFVYNCSTTFKVSTLISAT